jgi:peptidoglycan/xylan/chitin deacetylase (PgdA/CDA1 family)
MLRSDPRPPLSRAAKTAAAWALYAGRLDRRLGRGGPASGEPLVLCYHRVVEDVRRHPASAPAMLVSTATLERQIDWLGRRYRFVDLDELAAAVAEGRRSQPPLAAVTFDDGYADVHRHGYPLLWRKGVPFAVFAPSDWIGSRTLHAHDELYLRLQRAAERRGAAWLAHELARFGVEATPAGLADLALLELNERLLRTLCRAEVAALIAALDDGPIPDRLAAGLAPMSWSMLAELVDAGVVVGSHTRSHRVLTGEARADVVVELVESKRVLGERLGIEIEHLAYPNGEFSPESVAAARAAGYRYAYTTCGHRLAGEPLLTLPRRTFWELTAAGLAGSFSPAVASCHVHGVFDRLRPCRREHRARPPRPAVERETLRYATS